MRSLHHLSLGLVALLVQAPSTQPDRESRRMADGRYWTIRNLNVNTSQSYCYDDSDTNCRRYGRLYTWESAKGGCQSLGDGWRLPTDAEWRQMTKDYGGLLEQSAAGATATYRALIDEGTSGFDALLGGNRAPDGRYERLGAHGFYWTASETDPARAVFYNFGRGAQAVNRHVQGDKRMAVSVRCIKA